MTECGTTVVEGRFTWGLIDNQLEVEVPVSFLPDPGIPVPLAAWQSQIDGVWNKFAVVEPQGRKIPIHMTPRNIASAERKIKVVQNAVPGAYGCSVDGKTCDRANAGKWYPVMPASTAPHEFGHLIGLPDEYQRYHDDFVAITGSTKVGPVNASGRTPLAIAKELHAALYRDDEGRRAVAATAVLTGCGLIVGGVPQQGDFALSVKAAYDDEYGGWFSKYLLEALRDKLPEHSNWTLLSVFSYASGTIMGNPPTVGVGHDHPVEPRHMREFKNIVARVWPAFAWTIGPQRGSSTTSGCPARRPRSASCSPSRTMAPSPFGGRSRRQWAASPVSFPIPLDWPRLFRPRLQVRRRQERADCPQARQWKCSRSRTRPLASKPVPKLTGRGARVAGRVPGPALVVEDPAAPRLEHRGREALPIELDSATVAIDVWHQGLQVASAQAGPLGLGRVMAVPGGSVVFDVGEVARPAGGLLMARASLVADDEGVFVPVTVTSPVVSL
jgi:hypothetical protein